MGGVLAGTARQQRLPTRAIALASALPERALQVSFAMLQSVVAAQLARRALASTEEEQTA